MECVNKPSKQMLDKAGVKIVITYEKAGEIENKWQPYDFIKGIADVSMLETVEFLAGSDTPNGIFKKGDIIKASPLLMNTSLFSHFGGRLKNKRQWEKKIDERPNRKKRSRQVPGHVQNLRGDNENPRFKAGRRILKTTPGHSTGKSKGRRNTGSQAWQMLGIYQR